MLVMPSLDIEGGKVVKRVEGVRGTGLVVGDPVETAAGLAERGVEWVHVVDLDGAEAGRPVNAHVVKLLRDMGFRVQFGGGIRSEEHARLLLDRFGAERIVIGTLVFRSPLLVEKLAAEYGGDRLVAALDARYGVVVVEGWRRETGVDIREALEHVESLGVRGVLYTSVEREGRLAGVDVDGIRVLRGRWPWLLEYAGGIASIADIEVLAELGVDAAVVGMAFHAGLLDIVEASMLARRV